MSLNEWYCVSPVALVPVKLVLVSALGELCCGCTGCSNRDGTPDVLLIVLWTMAGLKAASEKGDSEREEGGDKRITPRS